MSAENIKQLTIAGSGGGGQKAPSEDSDSLQSRSYVGIVDLLGEGQIGGLVDKDKSLYLNGTPLRSEADEFNFEDVSWDERKGTQNQDYITGFGDIETPFPVGTQLKYNVPSSFIVTNPRVDEVRIILGISALVKTDDDGDVHGSSVKFEFSMAMNGGRYEVVDTRSVIGKASSRYQRSYNLKLPKKLTDGTPVTRWSFQVKRLTADSTSQVESNETFVDSYAEIVSKKLTYPNSALIATRFNAEHFSSMPKREYLVDGLLVRVPSNYNPETRTYSGIWDGTFKLASSSNPAWIMYDLLLSTRYGLGEYIDVNMVDEARLYQVGQYCDQMVDDGFGKKEPRYSINCVINTRAEAYDLIMDISSVFNGMAYWAGDQVGFMIDAPSDPIMAFTPANIVGEFGYTGTSIKDRHSIAAVTWNDPEDDYKQAIEYVEDPDLVELYGVRKIDMQAFGCTSRGQAHRQGRWMLYTEHQQSETIVFTAGMDATTLMPGDIIQIQDPDRSGKRFGGRLVSCSARSATLDDAVDFGEFTGLKIAMLLEDGSFIERPIKTKTQANVRIGSTSTVRKLTTVTWEEALTKMPVAQGVWVISAPQLELVQARVVNVKQGEDISTAEITAVPHNPNKYLSIENGIMLEVPVTSSLNSRQQDAPTEVRIKQEVVTSQGIAKTRLVIDWDSAKNASQYDVQWKRDDGNWVQMPPTANLSVEVEDVYQGIYKARVAAKSIFGAQSYYAYSASADLKGKQGKPANVVGLTAKGVLFGMELSWIYSAGKDNISHVVIEHSFSDGHLDAKLLGNFAYPTTGHTITGLAGNQKIGYRIKVADKSGNESDWSEWASGTTSANPSAMLDILNGHIGESSLDAILTGKIDTIDSSVKQNIKDVQTNADAIVKEAKDRATSVAAEATARAAALTKEVTDRTAAISTATTKEATDRAAALVKEATDRAAALAKEVTDRNAAIGTATAKEASDRAAALLKEVTDRTSAITAAATKEATDRANAITAATTKEATDRANAIAAEATSRANAIAAATTKEATDRANAIAAETTARANAITTATTKEATDRANAIAAEAKARGDALTAEVTARNSAITAEATARAAAITAAVKVETTARTTAITKEVTDRNAAIAVETAARGNAITAEVTARNKAITDKATEINASVKTQVDALQAGITKEVTDRTAGDTAVRGELNAYKTKNDTAVATVLEKAEAAISNNAATASKVTGLQSSLDTTNANVAKKADATALNSYYTKTEADTAIAGQVNSFDAGLLVGGDNLWSLDGATLAKEQGNSNIEYLDRDREYYKATIISFSASGANLIRHDSMLLSKNLADVDKNSQYTVSIEVRASKVGKVGLYSYFNGSNTITSIDVTTEWKRFEFTPTTKPAGTFAAGTSQLLGFNFATGNGWAVDDWYEVRHIQMQKGTKATAFQKAGASTIAKLNASATALNATNAEVTRINGAVTAQGTSITKLQSDLAATDAKAGTGVTNAATAQQTANTAVTATEANAARITSLDSSFNSYKTANDQAIVQTNANVSTVEKTSTDADKALGIRIDTVVATAKTDKTSVTALVTAETTARTSADTALTGRIDALSASTTTELGKTNAAVTAEQTARTTADTALGKRIDSVVATATSDKSTLQSAITSEQTARTSADTALGQRIDTVTANATTDKSTLQTAITTEQTARTTADTALGQRIDTLTTTVSNNDTAVKGQIKTVEDSVTTLTGSTNTKITALESSLATTNTNVGKKADATTVNAIGNRVTTAEGKITSQGESITSLTNSLATTDANVAKKADAAALSSLNTKVETINGQVTTQGTSITTLNANLATTNTNVATAQSAANAANTLAGDKGKVIVQAAAPATADRLAQNLWIDITGGANTPKRWLTNAWVAVTDKVATDAAAAAANALSVANTKADAAAFNTLDTKVTAIEGNVTSQGTSITKLTNDLATTNTNVTKKADTTALTALDTKVTAVDGKVTTNASAITTLQGRATTIEGNVAKKAEATALNSYYTKVDADKAIAGQVNNFKANLNVGGDNLAVGYEDGLAFTKSTHSGSSTSREVGALTQLEMGSSSAPFKLTSTGGTSTLKTTPLMTVFPLAKVVLSFKAKNLSSKSVRVQLNGLNTPTIIKGETLLIPAKSGVIKFEVTGQLRPDYDWFQFQLVTETTADKVEVVLADIQVEVGNVATGWKVPVAKITDALDANSTAINTTNTEVSRVNGVVTAQGTSISKLQSDLATTDTKAGTAVVNAATAQQTANTAVTATESNASRITSLDSSFNSYKTANDAALVKTNANVSSVEKTSSDADKALGVRIDTVVATAKTDKTATTALVTAETTARTTADTALSTRIDTLSASTTTELGKTNSAITTEQQARTSADTALGGRIDAVIATAKTDKTAVTALVTAETTARTTADTALTSRIDTLTTTVASNNTKATGSIADVAKSVTTLEGSTNTKISTLQSSLDATNSNVAKKADATALNATNTEVSRVNGVVVAQGTSISKLQSDLTAVDTKTGTAITNAATAQTTANTAVTGTQSNAERINSLNASFDASRASASLIPDYLMTDFASWRSHYGHNLKPYFVTVEDGKIGNTVFRKPANIDACWNYSRTALPNDRAYKLSMWVRRPEGALGTTYFVCCPIGIDGKHDTANTYVSKTVPANGTWIYLEHIWDLRSSNADNVQLAFGFALNHATAGFIAEMQGFKVEAVLNEKDIDSTIASKANLDSVQTTLANADKAIGTRIDSLNTSIANTNTAVQGQIKTVADSVTTLTGNTNTKLDKLQSDLTAVDTKTNSAIANAATAQSTANTGVTKADAAASSANTLKTQYEAKVALLDSADAANTSAITKTNTDLTNVQAALSNADTALGNRIDSLTTTVTNNDTTVAGKIKDVADSVTTLSGNSNTRFTSLESGLNTANTNIGKKADATALTALTTRVTNAEGVNTSQGSAITSLENSVNSATTGLATKASSTALTAVDNKVTAANGRIDTTNSNVTTLTGRVSTVEGAVSTKAEAAALTTLTTRVSNAEGVNTSQGSAITSLENSVNHATTGLASKASSSALTAVDNKVTAANGRIDTTNSNVSTLSGRVSTVEGAVATKAEAAALTALTTRVTNAEGVNTSQGSAITTLQNTVNHATTGLATKASTSALTATNSEVSRVNGVVTGHTNQLTQLTADITTINGTLATKANASALNDIYTKTQADAKATEIAAGEVAKYDASLVIGGVNLIPNSFDVPQTSNNYAVWPIESLVVDGVRRIRRIGTTAPTEISNYTSQFVDLKVGTEYTISVKVKPIGSDYSLGIYGVGASTKLCKADQWTTLQATVKAVAQPDRIRALVSYAAQVGVWIEVKEWQAEIGNKATAWSPSPSDFQNALDANATAITNTNAEVSRVDGRVTTESNRITTLSGRVDTVVGDLATKADASALNSLTTRVATEEGKSTSQGSAITSLQNTVNHATTGLSTKASSSALTAVDNKVTTVDGRVNTTNSNVATLTGRVSTVEGGLATKADVTALNNVYTKTEADAKATSLAAGEVSKYDAKLVIGGRNLCTLPEYFKLGGTDNWASIALREGEVEVITNTHTNPNFYAYLTTSLNRSALSAGMPLIASYEIMVPEDVDLSLASDNTEIEMGVIYSLMAVNMYAPRIKMKGMTKGVWYKVTTNATTVTNPAGSPLAIGRIYNAFVGAKVKFRRLMIESASVSSNWVPSDLSVQSQLDANATAINTTNTEVTRVNGVVTAQGTSINKLQSDLVTTDTKTGTAINNAATAQTTANTAVTKANTNASNITALQGRMTTAEGGLTTKAEAAALNSLTTRVTNAEGVNTTQGSSITNLTGSLSTTNTNVAAAKTAADNAMAAADAKGKVFFQNAAPAVADRLAQNLWIDTTGGANTPKRWLTNAWVAVTDKVATDAAAAAAAANTTLTTKADASALTALTTRVTNAEGVNTSQGSAITSLENSVNNVATGLNSKASTSALNALDSKVTSVDGKVTTNASSITTLQGKMTTVENGLATKADASAVTSLTTRVTNAEGVNTAQATALTNLNTAVNGHSTSISETTTAVNGIKAVKTVTVNNNGVLSGYGLMSELVNGQVTSAFGINADQFYIGSPSSNKKLFIVTTGNKTIDGVTYPAGTWIDTANIANATIQTAHIKDLSVSTAKIDNLAVETGKIKDLAITTAKIGNAQITTAKIGDLQVDTLKIKDNAVTVPLFLEDARVINSRHTYDVIVVGEAVLTGIKAGERVMLQMYSQSASGQIYAINSSSGNQIYANLFLNDVQKATIKAGGDSSFYTSNDAEGGGGGGSTTLVTLANIGFGTSPTVYAFVAPTDNPKVTIKVNSSNGRYTLTKNVPMVFTVIGLKK